MDIKLLKINKSAIEPKYATDGSACLDLFSVAEVVIPPGTVKKLSCGWGFAIPPGYEVQIYPRSSLACKKEILMLNSPAIIDSDYRGEVFTYLKNIGTEEVLIYKGDRYAQMSLKKSIITKFEVVDELDVTERNIGGFGSTGR